MDDAATTGTDEPEADGVACAETDAEADKRPAAILRACVRSHTCTGTSRSGRSAHRGVGRLAPVPDVPRRDARAEAPPCGARADYVAGLRAESKRQQAELAKEEAAEARGSQKHAPAFGLMGGSGTCCGDAELAATVATFLHGVHAVKTEPSSAVAWSRRAAVWPRPGHRPSPARPVERGRRGRYSKRLSRTQFLPSFIRQTAPVTTPAT